MKRNYFFGSRLDLSFLLPTMKFLDCHLYQQRSLTKNILYEKNLRFQTPYLQYSRLQTVWIWDAIYDI